jgi:2-oxo-4-hydroxy-4-carboxy-5-ureidoimidazoline decarboxylase
VKHVQTNEYRGDFMKTPIHITLAELNALDQSTFASILAGVVEHSPWVVSSAWSRRPFHCLSDLASALTSVILEAGKEQQMKLLAAHPELAGQEAIAGTMTTESTSEQGRLGLNSLAKSEHERLIKINRTYLQRFFFPLIIALREHDNLESVFMEAERRLGNDEATELRLALDQVSLVIQGRLERLLATSTPSERQPKLPIIVSGGGIDTTTRSASAAIHGSLPCKPLSSA